MNEVLGRHDEFRGAKISSFGMEKISEGYGFVGEVWRIKLIYEDQASSALESIAAKFANRDSRIKSLTSAATVEESNVYRHLGTDSEFIMPRCFFSDSDPETGDIAILMEDLGRGRFGDNIGGISEGDAEAVVKAIAAFHAKWWGRTDLERTRWLPTPIDQAVFLKERITTGTPKFLEMYSEQVDDEFREVISLFIDKAIPILEAASGPPLTVVHGDLRPDNIVFDTEFRGCPVTAIDWQLSSRWKGVTDISYLATFGLTVNLRRTLEDRLVRLYHTTLVSEGVTGYSMEQCKADYRTGILNPFYVIMRAFPHLDLSDERGQTLAATLLERTSVALRDHDLVGLLRAM